MALCTVKHITQIDVFYFNSIYDIICNVSILLFGGSVYANIKLQTQRTHPFRQRQHRKFLSSCEEVINNMTSDEKTVFKLKSATHELLINSLEHGYKKAQEMYPS